LPRVKRKIGAKEKTRKGRGFSETELKEAGLSTYAARRFGIPVDNQRRTRHQENIEALHQWRDATRSETAGSKNRVAVTRQRLKGQSHTGRVHRGLSSSGKRMRGLLRSRK